MNCPATLRAGDSVKWSESLPDYPASAGWVLKQRLLWSSGSGVTLAGVAQGDDFDFTVATTDSKDWKEGKATLVQWVEKGSEKITLGQKEVTILPDLSVAVSHDGRSQSRKALDDAEAALANYMASGQLHVAEYEIAGRRMKFRDAEQIQKLITHYKTEVAKENAALALLNGGSVPGRVYYRG